MDAPSASRTLAVSSVMGASTAVRVGRQSLRFWSRETSKLLQLWLEPGSDGKAGEKLRDEILLAAERFNTDTSEEIGRGIKDLRCYTGADEPAPHPNGKTPDTPA